MYQVVVANGEETATANFNEVFPAWNLGEEIKSKYSLIQLIKGQMNQNLDIFFSAILQRRNVKKYM